MTSSERSPGHPGSGRGPRRWILCALLIVVAIALVLQGLAYIRDGVGGFVPYLIIIGGPALAVYYTWFLVIRREPSDDNTPDGTSSGTSDAAARP